MTIPPHEILGNFFLWNTSTYQSWNCSNKNFKTALRWTCDSQVKIYTKKYVLLMSRDWPAQYYIRRAVYNSVYPERPVNPSKILAPKFKRHCLPHDHISYAYMYNLPSPVSSFCWTTEIESIVPLIDPLHISLNAREDLCKVYCPITKHSYEDLFPGCQRASKPKTWRTSLILEIIYGS